MLTNARAIHITLLLHETRKALNIIGSILQHSAHYEFSTISKAAKLKFSSLYCTYSGFVINDAVPMLRASLTESLPSESCMARSSCLCLSAETNHGMYQTGRWSARAPWCSLRFRNMPGTKQELKNVIRSYRARIRMFNVVHSSYITPHCCLT